MVRLAVRRDEPAIYDHLLLLYAENAMGRLSPERSQKKIKRATRGNGGVIGIIDGLLGPVASVGLELGQWWYSDDWQLSELWVFVDPAHRGHGHEKALIDFAKQCASTLKVQLLMGIVSDHRVSAKVRLYQRMLPQAGALFLWGDKTAPGRHSPK